MTPGQRLGTWLAHAGPIVRAAVAAIVVAVAAAAWWILLLVVWMYGAFAILERPAEFLFDEPAWEQRVFALGQVLVTFVVGVLGVAIIWRLRHWIRGQPSMRSGATIDPT